MRVLITLTVFLNVRCRKYYRLFLCVITKLTFKELIFNNVFKMSRGILMAYIEEQRKMNALRRERILRRALSAPMNLPEQEFVAHFRLKKDSFKQLVEELRPLMHSQRRKTAVPHELKVNFYNIKASYHK